MTGHIFYNGGTSAALSHAEIFLRQRGVQFSPALDHSVTHLLLDVPNMQVIPPELPQGITLVGGKLPRDNYPCIDLLEDPFYLAENAAITAHCAVKVALSRLPITLNGCKVLVVGWGRIGKCLSALLRAMGACVTVAARKIPDRATALSLGYDVLDALSLDCEVQKFRIIFNTAPVLLISKEAAALCSPDCLKVELASQPGIAGDDVIPARGLPSKEAPESSGHLIAKTILRLTSAQKEAFP